MSHISKLCFPTELHSCMFLLKLANLHSVTPASLFRSILMRCNETPIEKTPSICVHVQIIKGIAMLLDHTEYAAITHAYAVDT